jgi:bacteriorhodopsin
MIVTVLVLAVSVAVLGAIAMIGTGGLRGNPVQAAIMFLVLPLLASYGFVALGEISGG